MLSSSSSSKPNKIRWSTTSLLLLAWWSTSVTGTLFNKKVMKQFPFPIAFTSLHLLIGAILDYIIISNKTTTNVSSKISILPTSTSSKSNSNHHIEHFKVCWLNGLFFSMAKYLTYLSYRQVPVSLTHTIKSMSPVFSVISQLLIFRHCVPLSEFLTLIPIIIGVTLSTMNEIHFEMIGFLAAVCSTILGVAQNTTSKYILTHNKQHKNKLIISPMQLHMYGSILSLAFLVPLCIYSESVSIYNMKNEVPYYYMVMSCCWLYGQTMASLFLLKRVSTVTHNVANTCKRFWIIVVSIIYFKQSITIYNFVGIVLALTGFFSYQRVHKKNNHKKMQQRFLKMTSIRGGISHMFRQHKNGINIHHRKHEYEDDADVELGENVPLKSAGDSTFRHTL